MPSQYMAHHSVSAPLQCISPITVYQAQYSVSRESRLSYLLVSVSKNITSCVKLILFLCTALQLVEVLQPWRHSTNEVLATQIEVFEDSQVEDDSHMTMPGGIDLNSHDDVFNTLFTKVV